MVFRNLSYISSYFSVSHSPIRKLCQRFEAKENLKIVLSEMEVKNQKLQKHIVDAQKQRIKIKEKGARYVPGTVNLQILGNGAPGSPSCVYLFTDQNRYLFNCGEGTQRLATEHKTKLARLEHIFVTQTRWKHIGGLPGLSLTIQDAGVPQVTIHGPPGLGALFKAMSRFVVLRNLQVNTKPCKFGDQYEDDVMLVKYIPLTKPLCALAAKLRYNKDQMLSNDDEHYYEHELHKTPRASTLETDLVIEDPEDTVVVYVCKLKPKPGILSLEKCVEKGIPPGPLLGKLKSGIDITLPNGQTVRAAEVKGPDDPGPVFLMFDIPDEEYLDLLIENKQKFSAYQANTKTEDTLAMVVIHFTDQNIVKLPKYQEFINEFSPSTKQLFVNQSNRFSGFASSHRIQYKLNQVHERIFPILGEARIEPSADSISVMGTFHLRPRKKYDSSTETKLNVEEYLSEARSIENFEDTVKKLHRELDKYYSSEGAFDFPRLIFLGTGSCIPNKTRNVSAILLYTSPDSCLLLDCGEGTAGQIVRFFGLEKSRLVFQHLKAVYVSHLHADHHMGLIGILQERSRVLQLGNLPETPVRLFAPEQISRYLDFYSRKIESVQAMFVLVPNGDLIDQGRAFNELNMLSIQTCLVEHCNYAFGIAMTLNDGQRTKITYSGDTIPSENLVNLGRDSTILVHEATMEDELEDEAKVKKHCTVSQAIEQGRLMNAKYTILTHFSQRYAKLPRIESLLERNVGIAFDNMQVSITDLKVISMIYPALKLLFSEDCDEMEQKAIKRMNKKLRLSNSRPGSPQLVS